MVRHRWVLVDIKARRNHSWQLRITIVKCRMVAFKPTTISLKAFRMHSFWHLGTLWTQRLMQVLLIALPGRQRMVQTEFSQLWTTLRSLLANKTELARILNLRRQTMVSNPSFSLLTLASISKINKLMDFSRHSSQNPLARTTLLCLNQCSTNLLSLMVWITNSSNSNPCHSTVTSIISKMLLGSHSEQNNKYKHMSSLNKKSSKYQWWALKTKNWATAHRHRFLSDLPSMGLNQSALTRKSLTRTWDCCLYRPKSHFRRLRLRSKTYLRKIKLLCVDT